MNKFVKIAIVFLLLCLIIGGGIYFKNSGKAFKNYDYQLVGSELYVNIREVLVSNKYNSGAFRITVPVNGSSIQDIYLSDGSNTKVIYNKNIEN